MKGIEERKENKKQPVLLEMMVLLDPEKKITLYLLIKVKLFFLRGGGGRITSIAGGAVAQSVESATPGEEVPGSIPAAATRSLLVGSVSV